MNNNTIDASRIVLTIAICGLVVSSKFATWRVALSLFFVLVIVASIANRINFANTPGGFLACNNSGSKLGRMGSFCLVVLVLGAIFISAHPVAAQSGSVDSSITQNTDRGEIIWNKNFEDTASSPTVVNGTLYIGTNGNKVYALNANTGDVLWTNSDPNKSVRSTPSVVNNVVYVGANRTVHAINAETGDTIWNNTDPNGVIKSSPTVWNGKVFIGSNDDNLYAIDAETGQTEWVFKGAGDDIRSSPTVINGTVYFRSFDAKVYAVDADTGNQIWKHTVWYVDLGGGTIDSSPTVDNGVVYVGTHRNSVIALEAQTGNVIWRNKDPGAFVESTPTVNKGTLYVSSWDNKLYAIDTETGETIWKFKGGKFKQSSPTIKNDVVYIGGLDQNTYAIDAHTGSVIWKNHPSRRWGSVESSPVVKNGVLFSADVTGNVIAYDAGGSGNSEGSRVLLGTLSHINCWDGDDPGKDKRLLDVQQNPDVPESTESVTVTAEVVNSSSVTLEYRTENGPIQAKTMNPIGGDHYQADIPAQDVGNETEYWVKTSGKCSSSDVHTYHTFDRVEDIAIIYAKYSDSGSGGPSPIRTGQGLKYDQMSKQEKINEYMASWRGSYGAVGFDFTFFDNESKWYQVESSNYYNFRNRIDFIHDAMDIAESETNFDTSDYDGLFAINPGKTTSVDTLWRAAVPPDSDHGAWYHGILSEGIDSYGTWLHELGHILEYKDLYGERTRVNIGEVGYTGLMGKGNCIGPSPAPISAPSKLGFHSEGWLSPNIVTGQTGVFTITDVYSMRSKEFGDGVRTYKAIGDGVYYVLDARGKTRGDDKVIECPARKIGDSPTIVNIDPDRTIELERGVYIYKVERDSGKTEYIQIIKSNSDGTIIDDPTISADGNINKTIPTSDSFVKFSLLQETGSGKSYRAIVDILEPSKVTNARVGSYKIRNLPSIPIPPLQSLNTTNITAPDLDLHAYDSEGNHVGVNYSTGEYEIEIPGVSRKDVSTDMLREEWIMVPDNVSVEFEVSSHDVQEWLDTIEEQRNITADDLNTTNTSYTFQMDRYGENVSINATTGLIDDSITTTENKTIAPGETSSPETSDFEIGNLDVPEGPHDEGDIIGLTAEVINLGNVTDMQDVTLSVGGLGTVDYQEITLERNESSQISLNWSTEAGDAGQRSIRVSTENDEIIRNITVVNSTKPANFTVNALNNTSPVVAGRVLNVTVEVTNTGGRRGTQNLKLATGNLIFAKKEVSLDPGEKRNTTISWTTWDGLEGFGYLRVESDNDTDNTGVWFTDIEIQRPDPRNASVLVENPKPGDYIEINEVNSDGSVVPLAKLENTSLTGINASFNSSEDFQADIRLSRTQERAKILSLNSSSFALVPGIIDINQSQSSNEIWNASIEFTVSKQYISYLNQSSDEYVINSEGVFLLVGKNETVHNISQLREIPSKVTRENTEQYVYTANTPNLTDYGVALYDREYVESQPGFGVLAAIIAALLTILIIRRRK